MSLDTILKFAEADQGISQLNTAREVADGVRDEATKRQYRDDHIQQLVGEVHQKAVDDYEAYRAARMEELQGEADAIQQTYSEKMEFSPHAIQNKQRLDTQYGGLTDSEVQQRYKDYMGGRVTDPHEQAILGRHLRERGLHQEHGTFRKAFIERGDDRPWEKLAPDLYRDKSEFESLKHGEARVVLRGPEGQRCCQSREIKDFFK